MTGLKQKSTRSVLKSVADYQAMTVWLEGADAHRAAGTKNGNTLGPVTSAFLKTAAFGELGMARISDAELAAHMTKLSGVAVSTTKVWKPRAFAPGACSVRLQAGARGRLRLEAGRGHDDLVIAAALAVSQRTSQTSAGDVTLPFVTPAQTEWFVISRQAASGNAFMVRVRIFPAAPSCRMNRDATRAFGSSENSLAEG